MEFKKIANFLDTTSDDKDLTRFVTKKWIELYDQSESNYNPNKDESSNPFFSNSDSFKYKTSTVGKAPDDNDSLTNANAVIPLKHLSKFWRALNILLINCEEELVLTWSKNCVLADMTTGYAEGTAIVALSGATFKITGTNLKVPVVTLSKENDIKLLEQLKTKLKRTIKRNKYRSQMNIQPQNNNFNYLIDPKIRKLTDYLFCHFQELLEEIIQQKIREIFFHIIMYQMSE